MRERIPHSHSGHVLYVGLLRDPGMLHRAKYSRFRNESITSFEEDVQSGPPLHLKGSSSSPASMPSMPIEDVAIGTPESSIALCTLIPRMANIKLANPSTLPSLKNFCLRTKEVPRIKLTECVTVPSSPTSPEISLTSCLSTPYPRGDLDKSLKAIANIQDGKCLMGSEDSASLPKQDKDLGLKGESSLETGISYAARMQQKENNNIKPETTNVIGRARFWLAFSLCSVSFPRIEEGPELSILPYSGRNQVGTDTGREPNEEVLWKLQKSLLTKDHVCFVLPLIFTSAV
ncbi:hypothetical protein lerEdw1_008299 [Lerista edwardsae]|nr:hypothetical protein lerEdw1_008299 [Lerista edwardsae]